MADAARAWAFELADALAAPSGPLHEAAAAPGRAATVEVACAMEGLADALELATEAVRLYCWLVCFDVSL